ncbi:lamin tail domain-containing protein [Winogradskyella sp.]|uniref:lamin tail domain-containing protein n=1 Tax=Winogradskyella sp. TaxID=1883156 RepID=UPI0026045284|nr:lamin tail domain-containing protein [Winogradskyella sp.]
MKHFYPFLFTLLISNLGFGQTTILQESFETDGQGTRYNASSPFNDGGSDHWNRTNGSDIANVSGAYSAQEGSFFWAAEDTDDNGGNGNDEQTLDITGININGFTSLEFLGLFGAGNGNGAGSSAYDAADYIRITYQIDGGGFQNLLWFSYQDNGDDFNEPIGLDTDFDGAQDGTILGTALQEFSISIAGTGSLLDIRIAVFMDGASEEVAFDNIRIQGIAVSANPTIGFDNPTSTENETNATFTSSNIPITVTNYDGNQIDIDVNVTGGTAEAGDFSFTSPTSLSFTSNSTQNITVDINDDLDTDDETIMFTITETSSVTGLTISQATHTLTILDDELPPLPEVIISEVMQNPAAVDDTAGEYFEVYNAGNMPVDLIGWTISDNGTNSHVIGSSVIIAPYDFAVLGNNSDFATNGNVNVDYEYSSFTLGNSDDEIILTDALSNEIDRVEYDGGPDWPDPDGAAMVYTGSDIQDNNDSSLWAAATFSQDISPDFGSPGLNGIDQIIVFLVYTGGSWNTAPSALTGSRSALILDGKYDLTTSVILNGITVQPGAAMEVTSTGVLDANFLDLESTSSAFASLILDGTLTGGISGNVTYRRFTNGAGSGTTGGNDLITSPVTGMFFVDLVQDPENEFNLFGHPDNGSTSILEYLFGPFDNSIGSYMTYFINDEVNGPDLIGDGDDAFENIEPVKGYRAGTFGGSTLAFRGGVNSGSVSSFDFDDYGFDAPDVEIWNLAGNPYPSYLNSQTFLSVNGGVIDETVLDPNFNAIYAYNDGTDGSGIWTIINSVQNSDRNIAPGQGFFVASNGTGELSFTPAMRTTVGTDDAILGRNSNPALHLGLTLSNDQASYETDFYFTANASTSLDPGYDAGVYSSNVSGFSLYSHLVQDNQGIPMAIQSLGETDYNDAIIPLGVNANQGEQITFSLTDNDLPGSVNVYLEDNIANTFTLLNTADYILTPNTNLAGTGRFFLHFANSALSTPEDTFDSLTIFTDQSNRSINIAGEVDDNTIAKVYDIQGRLITSKALTSSLRLQSIDVNAINSGVYVVELSNGNQNKTQKVILK